MAFLENLITKFKGGFFMICEKHIKITGYSNVSWKDAIVKSIAEASCTLNNLSGITVLSQRATLKNDKIDQYLVDLDVTFFVESAKVPENEEQDNM
jgi:flavin-binding protein dodecin